MKKWIVTISAALSTLDLFWKDRIEKRPDSAKEEEMFGGKIRIRKVHNYGFALGMLSGEDRLPGSRNSVADILHEAFVFQKGKMEICRDIPHALRSGQQSV